MAEDDNGQDEGDGKVNDEDKDEGFHVSRLNSDNFQREVHSVPEWVRHLLVGKVMTYNLLIKILSLEEVSEITSQLRANFIYNGYWPWI